MKTNTLPRAHVVIASMLMLLFCFENSSLGGNVGTKGKSKKGQRKKEQVQEQAQEQVRIPSVSEIPNANWSDHHLNEDILNQIIQYLSVKDWTAMSLTCKEGDPGKTAMESLKKYRDPILKVIENQMNQNEVYQDLNKEEQASLKFLKEKFRFLLPKGSFFVSQELVNAMNREQCLDENCKLPLLFKKDSEVEEFMKNFSIIFENKYKLPDSLRFHAPLVLALGGSQELKFKGAWFLNGKKFNKNQLLNGHNLEFEDVPPDQDALLYLIPVPVKNGK
jgi:hypothetical protein